MVNRSISTRRIAFVVGLVGGLLGCRDKLDNGGGGGNSGGLSVGGGAGWAEWGRWWRRRRPNGRNGRGCVTGLLDSRNDWLSVV